MKTLRRHILARGLLPLILISGSIARSQDSSSEQAPPPTQPYVASLSGDFTLAEKFHYLSNPDVNLTAAQKAAQDLLSPPSKKPAEIDVVSNGGVRKDVLHFLDGSSREVWRFQIYRFTVYSAHPEAVIINVVNTQNNPLAPNQYHDASDFSELSWISGNAFQGIQMQQDKKCYAYKVDDKMAWIDVSTKWPVYFESKNLQITYTFSNSPEEPLQLPKGYAEKLQNFQRALRGQM